LESAHNYLKGYHEPETKEEEKKDAIEGMRV
jgi:hypothetical protein